MITELMEISEEMSEFLHTKSSMMILQIDSQQLITYCNNGFLKLFSLTKMPIGAGFVDFLLPGPTGVIFDTGVQEFICNPRTGQHGILAVNKLRHTRGLSLWCEPQLATRDNHAKHKVLPNDRFGRLNLLV